MAKAYRSIHFKDGLFFIGCSLYSLAASNLFLRFAQNSSFSLLGGLAGLSISFSLAVLLSMKLRYKTNKGIIALHVLGFLMLPHIDMFQIAIFQIRFSLESILFYFLFIKLLVLVIEKRQSFSQLQLLKQKGRDAE